MKLRLPYRMADHGNRHSILAVIIRTQQPSRKLLHTENREVVSRDHPYLQRLRRRIPLAPQPSESIPHILQDRSHFFTSVGLGVDDMPSQSPRSASYIPNFATCCFSKTSS